MGFKVSKKISIVINLDSRPGFMEQEFSVTKMFDGARSLDFFTEGIKNKIKFFDGHDLEITVFIDVHEPVPVATQNELLELHKQGIIDNLVFNRHIESFQDREYFGKYNDLNFLNALVLSRGEYVCHFDGDMAAFTADSGVIDQFIQWIDSGQYDYISYSSPWSPSPDIDKSWDYFWASTRFFFCKREIFDYTEIVKCLKSPDYLYGKYGEKHRRCPWLEHILGIMAGPGRVFYPPLNFERYLIFAWSHYVSGVFGKLNQMSYTEVLKYVYSCGRLKYPCDLHGRAL